MWIESIQILEKHTAEDNAAKHEEVSRVIKLNINIKYQDDQYQASFQVRKLEFL